MVLQEAIEHNVRQCARTEESFIQVLKGVLDRGQNPFTPVQLYDANDIEGFYFKYQEEIDAIVEEDPALLICDDFFGKTKLAIEVVFMRLEEGVRA